MPRIEVDPGQLQGAGTRQAALADQVSALGGTIDATGSTAAGAAGEPIAGAAISDFATAWSLSMQMLAQSLSGIAGNVSSAGTAYASTDQSVMPQAGR
jgi:uncharacterized protein YukE